LTTFRRTRATRTARRHTLQVDLQAAVVTFDD
jgi:hypothetical protein